MTPPRFECTLCGACCRRPGVVVLGDDELKRVAGHLGVAPYELVMKCDLELVDDEWQMEIDEGEACVFLADDRCTIHDVKPRQCRTYPFWPEILDEPDAWTAEGDHCPGIGRGPKWSPAEVRAMLSLLED